MVEMFRVVRLNFMVEKFLKGRAAMLLNAAAGAVGGNAGEEVGDTFIFWAFGEQETSAILGGRSWNHFR